MSQRQTPELVSMDSSLGYALVENNGFRIMTNWIPEIIAVVRNAGNTIEGCIVEHPPKGVLHNTKR